MTDRDARAARQRREVERALRVRLTSDEIARATSASRLEDIVAARFGAGAGESTLLRDARRDVLGALPGEPKDAVVILDVLPPTGRIKAWRTLRRALGVTLPVLRWSPLAEFAIVTGTMLLIVSLVLAARVLTQHQLDGAGHVAAHVAVHLLIGGAGVALIARINRCAVPPWPYVRVGDLVRQVVLQRARTRPPGGTWTRGDIRDVVASASDWSDGRPPAPLWAVALAKAIVLLAFFAFMIVVTAPR